MKLLKIYRIKTWFKNIGVSLIGLLSLDNIPKPEYTIIIPISHTFLIQMHSFSMNDYFDFKLQDEKNHVGKLILKGKNEKLIIFLLILPLLFILPTLQYTKNIFSIFLLLTYIFTFFIYQSPFFRLKRYYLPSIIINALCLGTILYIYPYLFFSTIINCKVIIFSLIFFTYVAFQEIIHQIAHLKKDLTISLPKIIGKKRSLSVCKNLLWLQIIIALQGTFTSTPIFIGTIFFTLLRIKKLNEISLKKTNFEELRNKLYGIHEGLYYLITLSLSKFTTIF